MNKANVLLVCWLALGLACDPTADDEATGEGAGEAAWGAEEASWGGKPAAPTADDGAQGLEKFGGGVVDEVTGLSVRRVNVEGPLIGRQRVAYLDTGDEGPTVVLVHSNSCNAACWERQLSDTLPDGAPSPLAGLRRVALDLPGHGRTRRVDGGENAYSLAFYAEAVANFADALELEGAVFVGHSLGGHAVIEAGQHLPAPAGAMVFGTPPVSTHEQLAVAFFPTPGGPHFLTADLSPRDVHHWQASVFYAEIPDWFERSVRRTDPLARSGLAGSLGVLADEVGMVVDYPCPFAIVHGQFERSVRQSYLDGLGLAEELWGGGLQIVAEANHFTQYDQPSAFNGVLAALVADVN